MFETRYITCNENIFTLTCDAIETRKNRINMILRRNGSLTQYIGIFIVNDDFFHTLRAAMNELGGYGYTCTQDKSYMKFTITSKYGSSQSFRLYDSKRSNLTILLRFCEPVDENVNINMAEMTNHEIMASLILSVAFLCLAVFVFGSFCTWFALCVVLSMFFLLSR